MKTQTGGVHASVGFSSGGGYIVPQEKSVIGYQIRDAKTGKKTPFEFRPWEIFLNEVDAQNFLNNVEGAYWKVFPVLEGEIENPSFI